MTLIITLGDSVTVGVRPGVTESQTYSALLEKRLRDEGREVRVISRGVPGENTTAALLRLPEVLALQPSFVTVMYGLNDAAIDAGRDEPRVPLAQHGENLTAIIDRLREAGVRPVLMTPNPMDAFDVTKELYADREPYKTRGINFMLKEYVATIRQVGIERKVPVIDVFAEFAAHAVSEGSLRNYLTDGMHPNPAGHEIITAGLIRHFTQSLMQ